MALGRPNDRRGLSMVTNVPDWLRRCIGCFVVVTTATDVVGAMDVQADSFTIRADWFDRGNVRISTPGQLYADKYPCIWNAGQRPNQTEYDLDFPVTTDYALSVLFTAAASRPVDIYLDGKKVRRGVTGVTGSWQTRSARWEAQCVLHVSAGKHTIKLLCPGPCMPHICALRFASSVPFPATWKLRRRVGRPVPRRIKPAVPPAHRLLEFAVSEDGKHRVKAEVHKAGELNDGDGVDRNELLQPQQEIYTGWTPWRARLSVRLADGKVERQTLDLSPGRVREMLHHTVELVDDFRTMDGVATDYLERERGEAEGELAALSRLLAAPDGRAKWERFYRAYVAAYRLRRCVALRNPLLDFDRLLLVKRRAEGHLGLPHNWQSNSSIDNNSYDNEIAVLSPIRSEGSLTTLYKPDERKFVGDVDLNFDADRMLFSSAGPYARWHVFEIRADGTGLRQVTPSLPDVNHYDACYLPDGRILYTSTASMAAVPCVNGSSLVANLYRMDADGTNIRQLCFDQEHNWCPTVLPNGRVLYLRWEYTDTPHTHDRVLFHMNPDGTGQTEYYGSNSYWPNALFYARPIPGQSNKFVGIVSGHHGVRRMGELVVFDRAKGRREADGAIQRIPGRGKKVEAIIADQLVDDSWPKFLHPYPLSDKYFLVSSQPVPSAAWGLYLVDVFDNMILLKEAPGYALFEPIPFRKTLRPPVIPDKVDLQRDDARVYLVDIYAGDGLKGIPRGTVKKLRVLSYHYLYPSMGGPQGVVGMEGPWDIKRILGTVPVEEDGSALFRVPANTPMTVQPLDAEGKALQLMRSWFTAMPGEVVSCVGCHEDQKTSPPVKSTIAYRRAPSAITPWHGPARGFSFAREVQPVLNKYCVGCHDGREGPDGGPVADLRGREQIRDYTSVYHYGGKDAGHFSTSYVALHRFVRRPGLESDYHMLTPMEFHADTTQLVQLLEKGHYNVQLDEEAWDRLVTWIDLNAPYHGTWTEIAGRKRVEGYARRRRELLKRYAHIDDDSEVIPTTAKTSVEPIVPEPRPTPAAQSLAVPGWPFDAGEAKRRQAAGGKPVQAIELAEGIRMELIWIPAGEFIMGSRDGDPDERPRSRVKIDQPFWMARCEVTNAQYAVFDASHDSRVESRFGMQFGVQGFPVNKPPQPVVRISWRQATAFCDWLSRKTHRRFTLPTEAQWEYACRAGTASPLSYGDVDTDFAGFANLADRTLSEFVCHPYKKDREPYAHPSKYDDWIPKDDRFDDGGFLSVDVGAYRPNAWGLCDMHGNVWEWTRSAFRPYPYRAEDGRNDLDTSDDRVVRGGSWRDRPFRARSACRLAYRPYQCVYNVGFRVVCDDAPTTGADGASTAQK